MAFCITRKFMTDVSTLRLAVGITPREHALVGYPLLIVAEERITIYVVAVSNLLTSFATDSNIAKAKSGNLDFRKADNEILDHFAVILRTKVVRCVNAYLKETKKGIFIHFPLTNIHNFVQKFWVGERNAHLLKISQHADTLLEQRLQVGEPARVASSNRI